jgi:exopolysaccharide production protein ExoZ
MKLSSLSQRLARLYEVSSPTQRTLALDGTRGLAVALVFFVHYHALYRLYVSPDSVSFQISEFLEIIGHSGVDLFFVLSGYLIYGIVIQKPQSYPLFLWRRVKRIYPTFLCVFFLYLILSFLFPERSRMPAGLFDASIYVLQNITLMPGIFPIPPLIAVSWTLSYEFAFYLSLPLLIRLAGMRSWGGGQRILLFLGFIALHIGLSLGMGSELHLRLVLFVVGILLWETLSYTGVKEKLTRLGEAGAIVIYLGSLVLSYWLGIHPSSLPVIHGFHNLQGISRVFLMAVGSFAFGIYCFGFDGVLNKRFSQAPLRWLGNMSYSYYLIHGLALNGFALVLTRWFPPSGASPVVFWSALPCAFLMTLVTATILFAFVEKPFSLRQRRVVVLPSSSRLPAPATLVAGPDRVYVQQTAN